MSLSNQPFRKQESIVPVGPRAAIDAFYAHEDAQKLGLFGDLIRSTGARIKAVRSNTQPREVGDWALFHDEF